MPHTHPECLERAGAYMMLATKAAGGTWIVPGAALQVLCRPVIVVAALPAAANLPALGCALQSSLCALDTPGDKTARAHAKMVARRPLLRAVAALLALGRATPAYEQVCGLAPQLINGDDGIGAFPRVRPGWRRRLRGR